MKLIESYRKKELVDKLLEKIYRENDGRTYRFMEVCGTHTMAISRFGIRSLLPENIKLISGPGCPVCVTSQGEIDAVFELVKNNDVVIATYGDLLKVPGSNGESLLKLKNQGYSIEIVYSPLDIVKLANNTRKNIVFLSIGFETTTPPAAVLVLELLKNKIDNVTLFVMNKTMPQIFNFIIEQDDVSLDGFLCPGHVSVITGKKIYYPLVDNGFACVISGFEPVDVLSSVLLLIRQCKSGKFDVENNYGRVVSDSGNRKALELMEKVFEESDAYWRGIGFIPKSGLRLRKDFEQYDAVKKFGMNIDYDRKIAGCRCGEILLGKVHPFECPLFGNKCTPETPVGPCMVSSEGTCAAYYKYGG